MLEAGADSFAGAIPLILKMNSANSLATHTSGYDQAVTASIDDALRLGCSAIGFTIYPGSDRIFDMMEEIRELSREAKSRGIATVIWSYARGSKISKDGELGVDVISYGAHMAALLGAHIIKVKLPSAHLEQPEAKKAFEAGKIPVATLANRVEEVVRSCFNGRRLVVFSGGETKSLDGVYDDARAIRDGGGNGSIIGRNSFQRPRDEALAMFQRMINILLGKEA
jgi:class I fructose-bisphosphate aldolase